MACRQTSLSHYQVDSVVFEKPKENKSSRRTGMGQMQTLLPPYVSSKCFCVRLQRSAEQRVHLTAKVNTIAAACTARFSNDIQMKCVCSHSPDNKPASGAY